MQVRQPQFHRAPAPIMVAPELTEQIYGRATRRRQGGQAETESIEKTTAVADDQAEMLPFYLADVGDERAREEQNGSAVTLAARFEALEIEDHVGRVVARVEHHVVLGEHAGAACCARRGRCVDARLRKQLAEALDL